MTSSVIRLRRLGTAAFVCASIGAIACSGTDEGSSTGRGGSKTTEAAEAALVERRRSDRRLHGYRCDRRQRWYGHGRHRRDGRKRAAPGCDGWNRRRNGRHWWPQARRRCERAVQAARRAAPVARRAEPAEQAARPEEQAARPAAPVEQRLEPAASGRRSGSGGTAGTGGTAGKGGAAGTGGVADAGTAKDSGGTTGDVTSAKFSFFVDSQASMKALSGNKKVSAAIFVSARPTD